MFSRYGETGNSVVSHWECKLVLLVWRITRQFPVKKKMKIIFGSEILVPKSIGAC